MNKDNNKEKEGVDDMSTVTTERYCTVGESLKQSLIEVKLMQDGKLPKKSLSSMFKDIKEKDNKKV